MADQISPIVSLAMAVHTFFNFLVITALVIVDVFVFAVVGGTSILATMVPRAGICTM
jgi:hypothetical protein